ncbi:MAG: hypothetical protein AB1762_18605 [Gemmatimonadota bacterium]
MPVPQSSFHRWLVLANVTLLATVVVLLMSGFTRQQPTVLTVERINIVDANGRLALVLSNGQRLPGARFSDREYPQSFVGRGRSAGLLFYNEGGDEVGGLIYEGAATDSTYRAFGHLSFDQWQQNQVVAVQYQDNGRLRSAGVRVWDRPVGEPLEQQFALAAQVTNAPAGPVRDSLERQRLLARNRVQGTARLFLGSEDRMAKLELRDTQGRVRVRLAVDSLGVARLAFLDARGSVVAAYP